MKQQRVVFLFGRAATIPIVGSIYRKTHSDELQNGVHTTFKYAKLTFLSSDAAISASL